MNGTIDGPRGSRLIFLAAGGSPAHIEVSQLRRVRQPVSRSKSGVQGKVADVVSGRSRHVESQNELKAYRVLLATAHPDAWQEQPFVLEYHHQGTKHRYTPDVLVVWGAHQEVVEIKEDSEAEKPENRARFALIAELLAEHGYTFRLWKRSEICAEPRLENVGFVLRYRCVNVPAPERERIRRALSAGTELDLGFLCQSPWITIPSVFRLVLDGVLYVDWWEPLSLSSKVSTTPIGLQVWPFLPLGRSSNVSQEAKCR